MSLQVKKRIQIVNNEIQDTDKHKIRDSIIAGLMSEQKRISSKFFYDKTGSNLFEQITRLDEYYPSRTEKTILENVAKKITPGLKNFDIVELGSGDASKISIILNAIDKKHRKFICYIPVDISQTALEISAEKISKKFPDIRVKGLVADFMSKFDFTISCSSKLICFFGSTIGNLTRKQSLYFVQKISEKMKTGDKFLLGLDMVKSKIILEAAYNDNQNITAKFNKNILNVINSILETNFNTDDFEHLAFYNSEYNRIEMHLKALKNIKIKSHFFSHIIELKQGETIHTENSHKYTKDDIYNFANLSNLNIENIFSDSKSYFSLVQFVK